jgi:sulfiredoxin
MKRETFTVADIYVPVNRRATLEQKRVDEIAASMLDKGQQTPILVRADGARFVLVEGLHRLEAAKALGEKTIVGFLVDARKHRCPALSIRPRGNQLRHPRPLNQRRWRSRQDIRSFKCGFMIASTTRTDWLSYRAPPRELSDAHATARRARTVS